MEQAQGSGMLVVTLLTVMAGSYFCITSPPPGLLRDPALCLGPEAAASSSSADWYGAAPSSSFYLKKFKGCQIRRRMKPMLPSRLATVASWRGAMLPHIFKCAGTLATGMVAAAGGRVVSMYDHRSGNRTRQEVVQEFVSFSGFKAALIRDPLVRAGSAFHEAVLRRASLGQLNGSSLASFNSQTHLISMFLRMLNSSNDVHFASQYQFLIDDDGRKLDLHYIGMADNAEKELRFIFRHPGMSVPQEHASSTRLRNKYAGADVGAVRLDVDALPDWVVREVCWKYVVDYCCLGFRFPPACSDMVCSDIYMQQPTTVPGGGNASTAGVPPAADPGAVAP